jgi:hypothetical protein
MTRITPAQTEAMDEAADWAIANVERPRKMAPDTEIEARYGALQQSLAHYRKAGESRAFSRADIIIASAQRDSSEIGSLRGEVRRLCDEIDAMSNPTVSPAAAKCNETWAYVDVRGDADIGHALVRCFYDDDKDGDGDMRAVYLAGFDISQALSDHAYAALEYLMMNELDLAKESSAIDAAISKAES